MNDDLISRQAAIDKIGEKADEIYKTKQKGATYPHDDFFQGMAYAEDVVNRLPSAQPTLYGYNIEHLELIARVLQKEDLPPERVVNALKDIGRIVAIVTGEFEETLRKTVEQCMT